MGDLKGDFFNSLELDTKVKGVVLSIYALIQGSPLALMQHTHASSVMVTRTRRLATGSRGTSALSTHHWWILMDTMLVGEGIVYRRTTTIKSGSQC